MIRLTKIGISMAIDMLSHPSSCDESDIRMAVIDAIAGLKELQHYKDLEEQGRLVVLPCKVGDTVWEVIPLPLFPDDIEVGYVICKTEFKLNDLYLFGNEIFLTEEEAEEALKRLQGNE